MPLIGRFTETRYKEVPGTDFLQIRVADRYERDGERAYSLAGRSHLVVVRARTRYPFVPYFSSSGAIHEFLPRTGGLHVTLVLTGQVKTPATTIWRTPDALDVPLDELSSTFDGGFIPIGQ